jgi:hypothetical protein
MQRKGHWTRDELSMLENLISQGLSGDAIAVEIGRTKGAIVAKARNGGFSFSAGQRGKRSKQGVDLR